MPEVEISMICEVFNCTPALALEQDPRLIRAIMDYRAARNIDIMRRQSPESLETAHYEFLGELRDAMNEETDGDSG